MMVTGISSKRYCQKPGLGNNDRIFLGNRLSVTDCIDLGKISKGRNNFQALTRIFVFHKGTQFLSSFIAYGDPSNSITKTDTLYLRKVGRGERI
ncbi:MAG: hypothetical protein L3J18_12370 [Candidatus Brocadia sp.]|nr:MAG: hypothetical protein L3J18_12370 [Candidatus Brocadia sp.]